MIARSTRASALMLLASLIWGTAFVAQTASIGTVGPFLYTGLRFLLGAAVVLGVMALRRAPAADATPAGSTPGGLARDGALLGVLVAVSISLQQLGLESTTVANAGFISSLYVIGVPLLGMAWGRRVAPGIWLGALLATLGMYLLSVGHGTTVHRGDWLELAGTLFITLQMLLLGHVAPRHDPLRLAAAQFLVCGALCLGVGIAVEPFSLQALRDGAWPILYGGALSVGVAYTLQVVAQRDAVPAHAAVIFSMEGVFAALAGWLLLRQALDDSALLGCALMFAGLIVAQLPARSLAETALSALRRSRNAQSDTA